MEIWHRNICHANNGKWKKSNYGWNRNAKSRKNLNIRRKWKLPVLTNNETVRYNTKGDIVTPFLKIYFSLFLLEVAELCKCMRETKSETKTDGRLRELLN